MKMKAFFEQEKFEHITSDPLNKDIQFYQRIKKPFLECLPETEHKRFKEIHKLKYAYGIVKAHKEGHPLRIISSSFETLTSKAEKTLMQYLTPLIKHCKFSVGSTKIFKEHFVNEMKDKNFKNYEFCSLDIKSMYPSISTDKAIKLLSRLVFQKYKNLKIFPSDGRCKKMSPYIFETFMKNIFIDLNNVRTEIGFFKQTSGLPMGSPLSALIANIYVSEIETKILPEFLENGTVQFYRRYADDSACLIRKRHLPKLLKAFNQYDKNIKWLSGTMINEKLLFLDTEIRIENNSAVLYNYSKS